MLTEKTAWSMNGYIGIIVIMILVVTSIMSFYNHYPGTGFIFIVIALVVLAGITTIEPNEAVVLLLFGKYVGTLRQEGIVNTIPFTSRKKLSLRIRHVKSDEMTVTLKDGEKGIFSFIVTYHIVDTAKALFYAEHLEEAVEKECEIILLSMWKKWQELSVENNRTLSKYELELKRESEREASERFSVMGLAIIELHVNLRE